jgi:hypothetical protein
MLLRIELKVEKCSALAQLVLRDSLSFWLSLIRIVDETNSIEGPPSHNILE